MQDFAHSALSKLISGRQHYRVSVPGTAAAAQLSVVSFEAVEALGEPYRITIALTHPETLDRADFLGKPAAFHIGYPDSVLDARTFSGCITHFAEIQRTDDFTRYEFVIEPLVARLRLTHASRVYQHKTAPQIIEAVLRHHGLDGNQFLFKTRRPYTKHAFRLQYQQTDWNYIDLLMRQEGLYCYFLPGEFGDIVVFADDIDHYLYQPQLNVPYRETAGLEANTETVMRLQTHSQSIPQSVGVADYNPNAAWDRFKQDINIAPADKTTYGRTYRYGTHHLNDDEAKWEAQLRHEAVVAQQLVYTGESNVLELRPARILRLDHVLPDAPDGQVITRVTHRGARDQAYSNSFTSIPSGRRYRLPLNEDSWPRIAGTLSARVTSPGQYPYAYITKDGHYTVRFDLDFDAWPGGAESVPLRLAKPFAGSLETGFHFPVLDGTEAAIAFTDGNPNKPYIAHLHHNSRHPDHITNKDSWLTRNVIRTQRDNKLQMEDWHAHEHVKLSSEHSGKSQLTLGHIVDGKREKRGEGFELRTSGQGAVRAKGILITAEDKPGAQGKQLDMQGAESLLQQALQLTESMAHAASTAQAIAADYERQKKLLDTLTKELHKAGILVSAPAGMGLVTGGDMHLSAQNNLMATAGNHAEFSVLKRFTVAAGEAVSVFAHKMGIKIFAAKGAVELQAQSDEMRLLADKDMKITSANGRVMVQAKNELWLKCGGSYFKMTALGIEMGTRGGHVVKALDHMRQGPAYMHADLPQLPQSVCKECMQAAAQARARISAPNR